MTTENEKEFYAFASGFFEKFSIGAFLAGIFSREKYVLGFALGFLFLLFTEACKQKSFEP